VVSQRIQGTIALIGNPLPIHDNPVRVAEEIAMLDVLTAATSSSASAWAIASRSSTRLVFPSGSARHGSTRASP